jgi:mRNA-degrading endonuclease RelE of RelBE toxin-antitoxin system
VTDEGDDKDQVEFVGTARRPARASLRSVSSKYWARVRRGPYRILCEILDDGCLS